MSLHDHSAKAGYFRSIVEIAASWPTTASLATGLSDQRTTFPRASIASTPLSGPGVTRTRLNP